MVLENLQALSEVAYIRFASVYRKFQGIRDFVNTLNDLQESAEGSRGNGPMGDRTSDHSPEPDAKSYPAISVTGQG
jgi:transcriptional repressor NrdR